jgi:hypothetical protein
VAALALVISLSVQRRGLTASQRAVVAKAMEKMPEPRGRPEKGALPLHNKSRDDVAKTFKVGVYAVQQIKALLSDAPDLASAADTTA